MIDKESLELARQAGLKIKTQEDLAKFTRALTKVAVETALNAELDTYLTGRTEDQAVNTRNGYGSKKLLTDDGEIEIQTPRDRLSEFEPRLVKKRQTRFDNMDGRILSLYAKGLSTREITDEFKDMYDADVSATLISNVTNAVLEQVHQWQTRPLDPVYAIVYLDCIVVKIRQDRRVINQSLYLALGVNLEGHKDLLGMWLSDTEGAKFWASVLTDLKNRGVKDMLIACMDGLKGFPEAVNSVYPETQIQLCIVHMVRHSLKLVPWKDYKAVTADLKQIYKAVNEDDALHALDEFADKWDDKYPQISKSWRQNWDNLSTIFLYDKEIRQAIYTTNAIESLNSVIRKAVKKRKVFPNADSAQKVVFLAIKEASKKWTMPIRNWKMALNRFILEFGNRVTEYL